MSASAKQKVAVVGTGGSAQQYLDSHALRNCMEFFNSTGKGDFNGRSIRPLTELNVGDYDKVVIAIYRYDEVLHLIDKIDSVPVYWFNALDGSLKQLSDLFADNNDNFITNQQRLTVIYDLRISPPTYDFLTFLVKCQLEAEKRKLCSLSVIICPGDKHGFRSDIDFFSLDEMNFRVTHLLFPLVKLVDPKASLHYCSDRFEARRLFNFATHKFPEQHNFVKPVARHYYYEFFDDINSGVEHRKITSSDFYREKISQWFDNNNINRDKVVTITLRESTAHSERNSALLEWKKVAEILSVNGYCVVIIRDTDQALMSIEWDNVSEFSAAAMDVELRTALYESSLINLGVCNGPAILCFLSTKCRYLFFGMYQKSCTSNTYEHLERVGISKGKNQIRGASEDQYISWLDETSVNIISEVNKYFGVNIS
ncbi:hypothetical protein [Aliiglaciecola sp. LCG003]|uniref:hypothetical protein n=1 Tax=Aliiglaciecola sp. LCG003 TaxID=3053655 RepID=UPI002572E593|nr:hypothetical protein [Aliiglaciecola sp. LCG003]WJG10584.1 hypothetical protein QR722_05965 [Aliiglaciecola sp. LCG003]